MIATPTAAAASAAAVLALAGLARAQMPGEVIIEIDEPVLAPGESTSVRLWAGFDGDADFAMGYVTTSLLADAGGPDVSSAWSDVRLIPVMDGPGTTSGAPLDGGFVGITAGQLNVPPAGSGPDASHPIAFWEATFTAPSDLGAFAVALSTQTSLFDVYPDRAAGTPVSRLDGLTEGAGTIVVVPAPAGALVLFGLLAARRRASRPAGASRSSRPAA